MFRTSVARNLLHLLVVVLILGFAASAHAGLRMYSGSMIIEAFGNDTTTGNQAPFQSVRIIGIPLTGNCNTEPAHAKETLHFPADCTPFNPEILGGDPPFCVIFTVPNYGGAVGTPNNLPPKCGTADQRAGDPLTGGNNIPFGLAAMTTGGTATPQTPNDPRGFTLPKSVLHWAGSGASFEHYGAYRWEVHYGDLRNKTGMFSKNGGDGDFGFQSGAAGNPDRVINQEAGPNQFGGVMSLLGSYGDNEGYYYQAQGAIGAFLLPNWGFHAHGTGMQATAAGVVTQGYFVGDTVLGFTTNSGSSFTSMNYNQAFKWTTGMVTVEANQGTFPTHQALTGYDNRNAAGSGMIQLVSPMLAHWVGMTQSSTGSIAILTLNFAPEPSEWMMLAGGVSMLGLLFYTRRSRN